MILQVPTLLSIVCPAFEEEEVLPFFHQELSDVLRDLEGQYAVEVLYIDDGSRDRTLAVLQALAAEDGRVRYLSLSRNFGHQAALTAGLEHARGDIVITLDSDLQHPPALIPVLLEKWEQGFDIVLTIREEDTQLGFFKRFSSRCFYRLMRLCSDTEIRFAAADYRLLSRRAVDGLLQLRESHRFLRGMVQWLGFPAAEVPFQPASRKAGLSKYTLRRMLNFSIDALLSFSKVPLRLAIVLGIFFISSSLLYLAYAMVRWLGTPGPSAFGWTALLVSVYLTAGCILCALGLIGEYVGRIYEQSKGRPIYLLKERSDEQRSGRSQARRDDPREDTVAA